MAKLADLVLEGGGVKGAALVGAAAALEDNGYQFSRVAGTSAGAFVGACVAAGIPTSELATLLETVKLASFADKTFWGKFGVPGEGISMLKDKGFYKGDAAKKWLADLLKQHGIVTFADLKIDDASIDPLHPERRYKLVVVTSDITRNQMIRLPWDYESVYGLDPDKQLVADAVAASMAIPLGFLPQHITSAITGQTSTLVDGGVCSSFPVDIFDTPAGVAPRWPTFGVRLEKETPSTKVFPGGQDIVSYIKNLYETACHGRDAAIEADPRVANRTIFVDTSTVNGTDFGISPAIRQGLFKAGYQAAQSFLQTFSFGSYLARERVRRSGLPGAQGPSAGGAQVA